MLPKSNLSFFSLMEHPFSFVYKQSLPKAMSPRFSPTLSSKSFILVYFKFRWVNHFELISVKDI